jgi:GDPmannose 4,6-dehydratase
MQKTALITGITGQDGAYLADFLLTKNYSVIGLQQPSATPNTQNINHLLHHKNFKLIVCDITDSNSIFSILKTTQPDEIYNLAGQSHVGLSFDMPEYTTHVNAIGTLKLIETMRILNLHNTRFYQASTSEIFGNADHSPQNENTPLVPASPYAVAKTYAHNMVKIYRDSYGMHASCGILFNHESPIRGEEFVTRKITKTISAIHKNEQETLTLGNLNSKRDWGHARDYVRGMWMMLQQTTPDDYVLATGQSYSVRDFVERCFEHVNIKIEWRGEGVNEIGVNCKTGKTIVTVSPEFYRPNDVHTLCGDASKAKNILEWSPKISFDNLVIEMMKSDLGG